MGVVYEAVHARLHQRLAVKVLRPDFRGYEEVFARFEREARITAQLRSIHTARVIDVDTLESGLPYIVMEFLEGRDLAAEITELGPMPVTEAVDVALQIAAAMQEAHDNGIVHRDLKPANLFVCRSGGRRVMKVLDFGISRVATEDSKITHASACVGTPSYASPEQLADASKADARSDVWSLGTVLYEMLSGRAPFEGSVPSVVARVMTQEPPWLGNVRPDLPKELVRIVMTTLSRRPEGRFQSMRDLSAALAPFGLELSTIEALNDAQRGRSRVGEILVADGLLPAEGLQRALAEHRRTGQLLGKTLLDLGLVSRADLLAALAKQQGIGETVEAPIEAPIVREKRLAREAMTHVGFGDPPAYAIPGVAWSKARRLTVAVAVGLALGAFGVAAMAAVLRSTSAPMAPPSVAMAAAAVHPAEPTQLVAPSSVLAPLSEGRATTEARAVAPPPPLPVAPAPAVSAPKRGGPVPLPRSARPAYFDPDGI